MAQKKVFKTHEQFEDQNPEPAGPPPVAASAQVASVDDLLDEIDSVLETNAESFVSGFVQKGGQ